MLTLFPIIIKLYNYLELLYHANIIELYVII
jgi:hypothetical protein